MKSENEYIKGRGAQINTPNKFAKTISDDAEFVYRDAWEKEDKQLTQIFYDDAKSIVNKVQMADLPLELSANAYQGCEHGCVYCYARNTHEYWGYSAGIDFETKIIVKSNAPDLLRKYFDKPTYKPQVLSLSMNTDCYQPIEREMKLTRQLLEVCLAYRNPVNILTKNALVLRDLDLLKSLNDYNLVHVSTSITTIDEKLRQLLEPRTSSIKTRLKIIEECATLGIPTGVMFAPIIPGLNDTDMFQVLDVAKKAGAQWAGYTIVRLNGSIADIFKDWLEKTYPNKYEKVMHHIASCHGGQFHDSRLGVRLHGEGHIAQMIKTQFNTYCKKLGLNARNYPYNLNAFRRPPQNGQMLLFDE
jgi:DNA repair photolyase